MRLYQTCPLFSSMTDSEQREFFAKYRKKRDEDINSYYNSKIKTSNKKEITGEVNNVKITLSDTEKILLKKLGISITEFKKLQEKA
jgi:hypothetical protein